MPMKNPPHPGLSVRINCLEPCGLSVTEGAKVLGVSRQALSRLLNGQAGISPEMAIRLSKAFGTTPEFGYGCKPCTTSPRPKGVKIRSRRALPAAASSVGSRTDGGSRRALGRSGRVVGLILGGGLFL